MDPTWQWGLEVIRFIQQIRSPALDVIFRSITALGSKEFYFLLLPLMLWCVDFAAGVRLAVAFLFAAHVNLGLKDLFALPRPFTIDPSVRLYDVEGYGLPSGHAQLSTVVWGTVADMLEKTWAWIAALLLTLLIGISRIYLGVHFPTDVLAGWLIGALLLGIYIVFGGRIEDWLRSRKLGLQLAAAVILPLVLLCIHATEDTASLTGILTGAGVGVALLSRRWTYDAGGPVWRRGSRFLIGTGILLALRFGMKAIFPSDGALQVLFRFARYVILGLWTGFGALWLFIQLGLTEGERKE